jgi:hemerythrin
MLVQLLRDRQTLHDLMTRDHVQLEKLFEAVLEAFHADAREDLGRLWTALDHRLAAHFDAEERWALPAFARVDGREAAALRAEHAVIRRRLLELGVGVDLHAIHERVAQSFIDALRSHARREDALLYRWLDAQLDPEAAARLRDQVAAN